MDEDPVLGGTFQEKAKGFLLEPKLRFHTCNGKAMFDFFVDVGATIPIGVKNTTVSHVYEVPFYNGITTWDMALEKKNAFGVGFTGSAGTNYAFSSLFAAFAELYYRGLSITWKAGEVKDYIEVIDNGYTSTTFTQEDLNVIEKEIEYVDEITEEDNLNMNQPRKKLKDYDPFSSWGIRVGLKMMFGGTKE